MDSSKFQWRGFERTNATNLPSELTSKYPKIGDGKDIVGGTLLKKYRPVVELRSKFQWRGFERTNATNLPSELTSKYPKIGDGKDIVGGTLLKKYRPVVEL